MCYERLDDKGPGLQDDSCDQFPTSGNTNSWWKGAGPKAIRLNTLVGFSPEPVIINTRGVGSVGELLIFISRMVYLVIRQRSMKFG